MHDNAFAATRLTQKHGSTGRKTNIAPTFRFLEAKKLAAMQQKRAVKAIK
jgi:hypothetical protein